MDLFDGCPNPSVGLKQLAFNCLYSHLDRFRFNCKQTQHEPPNGDSNKLDSNLVAFLECVTFLVAAKSTSDWETFLAFLCKVNDVDLDAVDYKFLAEKERGMITQHITSAMENLY